MNGRRIAGSVFNQALFLKSARVARMCRSTSSDGPLGLY
ncbi:hypothetical protein C4J87_3697 [Pseudomonas sp. R1-43-08]|nr:hypothetical protein C4J88_3953 [Pseudomonas sp. R4-39-08]AZF43839.1 hypothetical protein C4J87_3697 [Pseudomonas sp. R1-43-08]AZF54440.1 hypothetical protein C4J85_3972 [Pseudomonas sp. R4-34-07]